VIETSQNQMDTIIQANIDSLKKIYTDYQKSLETLK